MFRVEYTPDAESLEHQANTYWYPNLNGPAVRRGFVAPYTTDVGREFPTREAAEEWIATQMPVPERRFQYRVIETAAPDA